MDRDLELKLYKRLALAETEISTLRQYAQNLFNQLTETLQRISELKGELDKHARSKRDRI